MAMDRARDALARFRFHRPSPEALDRAMKDTAWADGLRGIAAVMVVSSHLVLCYARGIVPPCCAPNSTSPYLFQMPIFRVVANGHSWVALFFILMGFVNSLKPLQLARSGQIDKALSKLASSSFSRIFRLVLPASAATIVAWLICNLGLNGVSAASDAFWLNTTTPVPSDGWQQAIKDLLSALRGTWVYWGQNPYDQPQWALVYLLQGSVMVISALSLVISMTPLWRTVTLFILTFWSLNWSRIIGDPFAGLCCFAGILLGEMSLSNIPKAASAASCFISPPLIFLALFLMSYPGSWYQNATWSTWLHDVAIAYVPADIAHAVDRVYGSVGGILLVVGIIISPHARWLLSRRPLQWLGKVSFAIYLLHGPLMRTVFAWVLHAGHQKQRIPQYDPQGTEYYVERYPVPGSLQCALATVALAICVAAASHVWNLKVEPVFAKITTRLEGLVTGKYYIEVKSLEKNVLPLRKD
ncbi:hypothetical protein HRR83_001117 [Exophiala dermatitidis]|uniref:Acyltransferase 3 domain-containing protein n=2 Tax=Exophiala dermatitidis TaxID=5970 RepID=H6C7B5_EXODN|nr:uncharacterized protein HMPREF1120_07596 [Exophiala dermatitidis NIH/UT8656]KAJ4525928.1 hypothetical protein HRR74_001121 [Exophiala dermatitidis]EHY59611.1 hypothetical protein HMPREF1120_07596 [Exophiala dermatitidis NIH/UT8656]KAJ4527125.1 hypothetical protein HRR73_001922 [Exophiala dermatitidis]KAJ4532844.1 hypothetical protein HRR76_007823 [Exophiala dermatitidis]KAJ4538887.1 hypothetical protein HRR77_006808 [Exophiala dermatitidis]